MLTPDIGVTSLSMSTCYAFWRWSQVTSWTRILVAGGILGLALLAKTNALVLYPALTSGVLLHSYFRPECRSMKKTLQLIVAFIVSIYVLNLGYGFDGSFKKLKEYEFFSKTFRTVIEAYSFQDSALGNIPIPLPAAFLEGIDLQRRDFENIDESKKSYLRGQWYDNGWWWYYFYVIAVKVPIPIWLLFIVGLTTLAFCKRDLRLESFCYILIPGILLFALPCTQSGFSHSLRYVLPAFPFAFMIACVSFASAKPFIGLRRRLSCGALIWLILSSLSAYPHSLSYFNEIAGGAKNGHFHLLDGNLDWGQDFFFLQDWIEEHPEKQPLYIAYWGILPLNEMNLTFNEPKLNADDPIPPGWYLISVNHLRGEYRFGKPELHRFLALEPIERITNTIYLYHIK
ncbi:MAG: hypothetical protein R3C11_27735 [Planctomycetaceae bacterium]